MSQIPVTLTISFKDLFGAVTEQERRTRWAQWLRIARRVAAKTTCRIEITPAGGALPPQRRARLPADEYTAAWTDASACYGDDGKTRCRLLQGRCWCRGAMLPASANPILSYREGIPGMACMGGGPDVFAERLMPVQLELFKPIRPVGREWMPPGIRRRKRETNP